MQPTVWEAEETQQCNNWGWPIILSHSRTLYHVTNGCIRDWLWVMVGKIASNMKSNSNWDNFSPSERNYNFSIIQKNIFATRFATTIYSCL